MVFVDSSRKFKSSWMKQDGDFIKSCNQKVQMSYRIQGWLIQNPRSCDQGSNFFPSLPFGPQHLVHSKAGWNPGNTKMVASSIRVSAFLFTSMPSHISFRIWEQLFLKPRESYSLSDLGQADQSHRCGKELAEASNGQPLGQILLSVLLQIQFDWNTGTPIFTNPFTYFEQLPLCSKGNRIIVTVTIKPSKPKMFAIWAFMEKLAILWIN